jgi:hypothetical protein
MKVHSGYVVKCIKGNNNRCGFGYRYKKGQYVTYSGRPTYDLDSAYVYNDANIATSCALNDTDGWEKYFIYVPVKVQRSVTAR